MFARVSPVTGIGIALVWFAPAAIASYALGFWVERTLRTKGVLDRPNERSSHTRPTVRGGGIGIVVVLVAGGGLLALQAQRLEILGLAALAAGLAVVSFVDDTRSLSPRTRFLSHLAAAVLLLVLAPLPADGLLVWRGSDWALPKVVAWPIVLVWLVGYTNAFNFMDGINGIAATQAILTSLGTVAILAHAGTTGAEPIAAYALVVAGAAAGFLPHNFPAARMFMGDVGSVPVGFSVAALTVWAALSEGSWLLVPLALLHANFVLDTGITLVRRVAAGDRWYAAHREHFYQRLVRAGRSHPFVTGLEGVLQVAVVGLMLAYCSATPSARFLLAAGTLMIWVVFFLFAESVFRRHTRAVGE